MDTIINWLVFTGKKIKRNIRWSSWKNRTGFWSRFSLFVNPLLVSWSQILGILIPSSKPMKTKTWQKPWCSRDFSCIWNHATGVFYIRVMGLLDIFSTYLKFLETRGWGPKSENMDQWQFEEAFGSLWRGLTQQNWPIDSFFSVLKWWCSIASSGG